MGLHDGDSKRVSTNVYSVIVKWAERALLPLDRLFNWVFSSEYNPLYQSGTIAVTLLFIAIVTGLHLAFFYSIGSPYESMLTVQSNVWGAKWVRSIHRYASDAAVVTTLIHMLRMVAQGKTWKSRTLAWISGILLLVLGFVASAWSGFLLVWDIQAQSVAVASARVLDALNIFSDPIIRSFDGSKGDPPASFFFLLLFLHIVLPLTMIFGLWIHTAKMARSSWFPRRKLVLGLCLVLLMCAVIWPFPLIEKANLLKVQSEIPLNWFYNFWVPWAYTAPKEIFGLFLAGLLFLLSVPFWLKPRAVNQPGPAFNDPQRCQGCAQCVVDCPYESIVMVPRTVGKGSPEVALVDPLKCVSCGLCSASCAPFTMGPEGRRGGDQYSAAKEFILSVDEQKRDIVIIGCVKQAAAYARVEKFVQKNLGFQIFPAQCAGTVHASVVQLLAKSFKKVAIVACPERNCTNKDGFKLLSERIAGVREPTFTPKFDRTQVGIFPTGDGEERRLFRDLLAFRDGRPRSPGFTFISGFRGIAAALLVFFGIGWGSQVPSAVDPAESYLRLAWRLVNQRIKTCVVRSEAEIQKLPRHMRTAESCVYKPVDYRLMVALDGRTIRDEVIRSGGMRGDRPLYVARDLPIKPGHYQLHVSFRPLDPEGGDFTKLAFDSSVDFHRGVVVLIQRSHDGRSLILKTTELEDLNP